jgi:RimJ/RimL family protein N-acetyltransferase
MRIIEGKNVDLICPFPPAEIKRMYGWCHCYRTLTETDDGPQTQEEMLEYLNAYVPMCVSFGVIDKNHLTNIKHEAPLVGVILFEPASLRTGYFHVATARKAWRTGLIDEAGELAIKDIFTQAPTLLRVGAFMFEKNFPARGLCQRLGFEYEGLFKDLVLQNGEPKNVVYFGLTRRNWECHSQPHYPQSSDSPEEQCPLSEAPENKAE